MDDLAAYESRFRRAGLPLLIDGYSAETDVFTRAFPVLALVFLGEVFGALNLEWSPLANVAAVLGGLAILLAGVSIANRRRGRRSLAIPEEVGRLELAGFVVLPALLPVVFGGQVTSALVTAAVNVALLELAYLVIGFGLLSIVAWAVRRLAGQLATSLLLLARAIPLLLLFAVVLFVNTEMWQVFSGIDDASLVAVGGLFVAVGTLFLVARLPREVATLERDAGAGPPLDGRQRLNVGLVMMIAQALQVLVVSAATGVFFVALGLLIVSPEVLDQWVGHTGHTVLDETVAGVHVHLTEELLRVASAIAAVSGLYYAIATLTDATYRAEFLDEVTAEMRETFRARAEYLELVSASAPTA
jgi:hypothetical protein